MANINVINGTEIVVKFGTALSEIALFCSTSCTLNLNADTVSASCKDGGNWAQSVEGNKSWDVSVDGLYQLDTVNGFVDLADLLIDGPNDVSIVVGQDTLAGDISWTGKAVLTSANLTAPDGEIATWSCAFQGNGEIAKVVKSV